MQLIGKTKPSQLHMTDAEVSAEKKPNFGGDSKIVLIICFLTLVRLFVPSLVLSRRVTTKYDEHIAGLC